MEIKKNIYITLKRIDECEKHIGIFFNEKSKPGSTLHTLRNRERVAKFLARMHTENAKIRLTDTDC